MVDGGLGARRLHHQVEAVRSQAHEIKIKARLSSFWLEEKRRRSCTISLTRRAPSSVPSMSGLMSAVMRRAPRHRSSAGQGLPAFGSSGNLIEIVRLAFAVTVQRVEIAEDEVDGLLQFMGHARHQLAKAAIFSAATSCCWCGSACGVRSSSARRGASTDGANEDEAHKAALMIMPCAQLTAMGSAAPSR